MIAHAKIADASTITANTSIDVVMAGWRRASRSPFDRLGGIAG